MDWKGLGKQVAKIGAPLLGTVLGGPAGGAIGSIVGSLFGASDDTPDAVMAAIGADPEAKAKLIEFQTNKRVELERLAVKRAEIDSAERMNQIEQVNLTMRAEAKSEKWPQYSWRPFNGFMFPLAVIAVYFVLPIIGKDVPAVPQWIWILWASILGVATMGRNRQKNLQAAGANGGGQNYGLIGQMIQAIKK